MNDDVLDCSMVGDELLDWWWTRLHHYLLLFWFLRFVHDQLNIIELIFKTIFGWKSMKIGQYLILVDFFINPLDQ